MSRRFFFISSGQFVETNEGNSSPTKILWTDNRTRQKRTDLKSDQINFQCCFIRSGFLDRINANAYWPDLPENAISPLEMTKSGFFTRFSSEGSDEIKASKTTFCPYSSVSFKWKSEIWSQQISPSILVINKSLNTRHVRIEQLVQTFNRKAYRVNCFWMVHKASAVWKSKSLTYAAFSVVWNVKQQK